MQAQSVPVYVQPPQPSRSFMNGTRIGGINIPGALILIILIGSSIALIIGFFMTVFGYDYQYYYSTHGTYYYRTSGVRKAGISFIVLGAIALIFGVIAAFKSNNENKITRGMIIQQVQVAGPSQPVQQGYSPGFGYNQNVSSFPQSVQPPQAQAQAQVQNEVPPPYQTWATEGVKS